MATYQGIGYFAEYDPTDKQKKVVKVGYTTGQINTNRAVILPDAATTVVMNNSQFSSFLFTMYQAGLLLNSKAAPLKPSLNEVMKKHGLLGDYENVKVLDIMSLLKAIVNLDISKYIPTPLNPTPEERPTVVEVLTNPIHVGDRSSMIDAIKFLGVKDFVKYIYAEGGLTFDEFLDLWQFFCPDKSQRADEFDATNLFLRSRNVMFKAEEVEKLLS